MNKQQSVIKYILQIVFAIGLYSVYLLTKKPLAIIESEKLNETNYDTTAELLVLFINGLSIVASVMLLLLGGLGVLKYLFDR